MTTPHYRLPPEDAHIDGNPWLVQRAWPAGQRLGLELRRENLVRAAWWDPTSETISVIPVGTDPKLPALSRLAAGRKVVSHRPGKRAVLHDPAAGVYIKVLRPGRAQKVAAAVTAASAFDRPFALPRVLRTDDSTVTFSEVPGVGLHEPAQLPDHLWQRAWSEVLAAWQQVVSTSPEPGLPTHGIADEIKVLHTWEARTRPYRGDHCSATIHAVAEQLASLSPVSWRPAHRDLHDKQLLWSPQSPGILDVDTACVADPGLDLGNLAAHIRLRRMQGTWSPPQAQVVTDSVQQAAAGAGIGAARLKAFERSALLRLGFVYAVRPQYAQLAARLRSMAAAC